MSKLYVDNIYLELRNLNKKTRRSICAQTDAKRKHYIKLLRYELMSMGAFKLAKSFR